MQSTQDEAKSHCAREHPKKCVTLVSACVTLKQIANPLHIDTVSACHPLFQKNHSKKNYNLTVTQLQRIIRRSRDHGVGSTSMLQTK